MALKSIIVSNRGGTLWRFTHTIVGQYYQAVKLTQDNGLTYQDVEGAIYKGAPENKKESAVKVLAAFERLLLK